MKNAIILFLAAMVMIWAVSIALAALLTLDWRPVALVLAISGGVLWGIRSARRERERWRLIQEYLAEPEES